MNGLLYCIVGGVAVLVVGGAVGFITFYMLFSKSQERVVRLDTRMDDQKQGLAVLSQDLGQRSQEMARTLQNFVEKQSAATESLKVGFEKRQTEALQMLQSSIQGGQESGTRLLNDALGRSSEELGKRMEQLTVKTDQRLQDISGQVEKRLAEGFEKTTTTFADVLKRLALIDEAQKKISELSIEVVDLQNVLTDKKSRGAFGEVQLNGLVRNLLPESSFDLQFSLSNGNRVDCMLKLPPPTGNIAIDAKFPLESYQRMFDQTKPEGERKVAAKQFKADIKKHIGDIASKYIIPGETSDGAIMFLPAEAVFAEIHAYHRDLVEEAQRAKVWICSPTTLMAVLSTVRAVLKDAATREQIHIIQKHLILLGKDFDRFQERMEALAKHVRMANKDVDDVAISAEKLTERFRKIEKAEGDGPSPAIDDEKPAAEPESISGNSLSPGFREIRNDEFI